MKWEISPRIRRLLKWAGFPVFYLAVLFLCFRLTFPFERVRQRGLAEFNARSAKDSGWRLEIEDLSGYWLFGLEAEGVRLLPPGTAQEEAKPVPVTASAPSPSTSAGKGLEESPKAEPKSAQGKKLAEFAQLHASFSPLRWLFGTKVVSFGAEGAGGELSGRWLDKTSLRELNLDFEKFSLSQLVFLADTLKVPLGGTVSGTVEFQAEERKLAKAEGKVELVVDDFSIGDGKTKLRGALALPKCGAGQLSVSGELSEGKLVLTKFHAKGPDVEAQADGQLRLRDPLKTSQADLTLRYKFTERYMGKNDMTKGLFGDPATGAGGLMDMDPKVKQARLPDGFYAWRVTGVVASLGFQPAPDAGSASTATAKRSLRRTARAKK
jgi:type II secretion system protein N